MAAHNQNCRNFNELFSQRLNCRVDGIDAGSREEGRRVSANSKGGTRREESSDVSNSFSWESELWMGSNSMQFVHNTGVETEGRWMAIEFDCRDFLQGDILSPRTNAIQDGGKDVQL